MAGEIRPLFDEEALKQLAQVNEYLTNTKSAIGDLNKIKVNFSSMGQASSETKKTAKATDELSKAYEKLNKTLGEEAIELQRVKLETSKFNAENKKAAKLTSETTTEYEKQRIKLKDLQTTAKELGVTQGTSSKAFREAAKAAEELSEELADIDRATGDYSSTVGRYRGEISKALKDNNIFGGSITNLTQAWNTFSNVNAEVAKNLKAYIVQQNVAKGATDASVTSLQKLRIALMATMIGAFVAIVGALAAAFLSTQRGVDALNRVLEPLKAIFESIWGVIQNLSTDLVDAFKNPTQAIKDFGRLIVENVLNRIKAIGGIVKAIAKGDVKELLNQFAQLGTGIENAGKRFTTFVGDAVEAGLRVEEINKEIRKLNLELKKNQAQRLADEKKLKLEADNTALSFEKRKEAVQKILALTDEGIAEEQKIIELQKEKLLLEQEYNDTKDEGQGSYEELAGLEAQLIDLQTKRTEKELEFKRVFSGIEKERQSGVDASIKAEAERIAKIQELARTEIEQLQFKRDAQIKELKLNRDITELTEDEQKALEKINQLYEEQVAKLTKKTELSIFAQAQGLLNEQKQLQENIRTLEAYYDAADPSVQEAINKELGFYVFQLDQVNLKLESLGALIPGFTSAQQKLNQILTDQKLIFGTLFDEIDGEYKRGEISAEQYFERVNALQEQFSKDALDLAINTTIELLRNEELTADERLELEKNLIDLKAQLRLREQENFKKLKDGEVKIEQDAAARREAIIAATFEGINQISSFAFDTLAIKRQDDFAKFQEDARARLDYQAQLLEEGAITQEQYLARKQQLENEVARKEAANKRKAAIADKAQALFNIGLNTARAITAALTSTPPNLILAKIVAATGAIQFALTSAKPIPKFGSGVQNFEGGLAEFGERGREIVQLPSGQSFLAPHRMFGLLPKGTNILNNAKTEKVLKDESIPLLRQLVKKQSNTTVNVNMGNIGNYVNYAIR